MKRKGMEARADRQCPPDAAIENRPEFQQNQPPKNEAKSRGKKASASRIGRLQKRQDPNRPREGDVPGGGKSAGTTGAGTTTRVRAKQKNDRQLMKPKKGADKVRKTNMRGVPMTAMQERWRGYKGD